MCSSDLITAGKVYKVSIAGVNFLHTATAVETLEDVVADLASQINANLNYDAQVTNGENGNPTVIQITTGAGMASIVVTMDGDPATGRVLFNAGSNMTIGGTVTSNDRVDFNAGVNMNWSRAQLEGTITVGDLSGGTITISGQGLISAAGAVKIQTGGNFVLDADPGVAAPRAITVPRYTTVAETIDVVTGYQQVAVGQIQVPEISWTTTEITEQGLRKVLSGVRIARRDPFIAQVLMTLASFSFFSVTFVGIMPQIAENSLGIDPKSWQYGVLYAVFGTGAALGATSVGTFLAEREKIAMLRPGFVAFAALLTVFALISAPVAAYVVVAVLGGAYFHVITCLSTALQSHLDDDQRGRVMALWIMGFGGTVPLGVLVAGPFTDHNVRAVMLVGVVWALVLAWWSDPARLARKARVREDAARGS